MSPYLEAIALSPVDRIMLRAQGFKIQMPDSAPKGRPVGVKDSVPKGRVKRVAADYLDGKYGEASFPDVGTLEGVDGGSLRAAVWRLRQDRKGKRRDAA